MRGDIYFRAATDPATAVSLLGTDIFISYRTSETGIWWWASDEKVVRSVRRIIIILPLLINGRLTTAAGCQAIADAEANAIPRKVREVNFVALGNPYLADRGCHKGEHKPCKNCIEFWKYRRWSEGSPVFATALRCYHYGPVD